MGYRLVANADLTKTNVKQWFNLGAEFEDNGSIFRYIRHNAGDGSVTVVAGMAAWGLDGSYSPFEGTPDGDSSSIPVLLNRPLGFYMSVPSDGEYCWVQRKGKSRFAMITDNGVAQGELLIGTTGDGIIAGVAANAVTQATMGEALEDDSGTALAAGSAFINCP